MLALKVTASGRQVDRHWLIVLCASDYTGSRPNFLQVADSVAGPRASTGLPARAAAEVKLSRFMACARKLAEAAGWGLEGEATSSFAAAWLAANCLHVIILAKLHLLNCLHVRDRQGNSQHC